MPDEPSTMRGVCWSMVKSYSAFDRWLVDQRDKRGSTHFLERAPTADEKEEFVQAFDKRLFKDRPKLDLRERGEWNPNTRTARSASDPEPYVPRKRKASRSSSPDEHPPKRRK